MPRRRLIPLLAALGAAVLALPAGASADAYTRCPPVSGAIVVDVARTTCEDAAPAAAAAVATTPDGEVAALQAEGWAASRARTVPRTDPVLHDIVAIKGTAAMRIRRPGAAPVLDSWESGRELLFAPAPLVGGKPVPRGSALCTSAFLVRLPGGAYGGLSAGHCGGLTHGGRVVRRYVALRRSPDPGLVLGRVRRILNRSVPLDALVLPVPEPAVPSIVDRGISRPPWIVTGVAGTTAGRRVCFTGRTSGVDHCGRLRGKGLGPAELFLSARAGVLLRCTTARARQGDSGGGVYTYPTKAGTVKAVGLVTVIVGRSSAMCLTPVVPVLDRLGAQLITGP